MHLQVVKINTFFSFAKWLENIVATWTEQTCVEFDISLLASADEARGKNPRRWLLDTLQETRRLLLAAAGAAAESTRDSCECTTNVRIFGAHCGLCYYPGKSVFLHTHL